MLKLILLLAFALLLLLLLFPSHFIILSQAVSNENENEDMKFMMPRYLIDGNNTDEYDDVITNMPTLQNGQSPTPPTYLPTHSPTSVPTKAPSEINDNQISAPVVVIIIALFVTILVCGIFLYVRRQRRSDERENQEGIEMEEFSNADSLPAIPGIGSYPYA